MTTDTFEKNIYLRHIFSIDIFNTPKQQAHATRKENAVFNSIYHVCICRI